MRIYLFVYVYICLSNFILNRNFAYQVVHASSPYIPDTNFASSFTHSPSTPKSANKEFLQYSKQ